MEDEYLGPYHHPINKRKDRPKILVSSWDFGPAFPQGERKDYPKSTNPAKMRPSLARAILQIYGEAPVLDPMAGSFTTCIEASKLGMESYGVEFERKFVKEAMKWKPPKGCAPIHFIKGDARELSKIFRRDRFGNVLVSPPYWSALHDTKEARKRMKSRAVSAEKGPCGYSEDPENIANLSAYAASFGTIIFSPPYWNAVGRDSQKPYIRSEERIEEYESKRGMDRAVDFRAHRGYGTDPCNIGNVPEYDENMFGSVVFSPPYYVALSDIAKSRKIGHRHLLISREKGILRQAYSNSIGNIGNISRYGNAFGCIVFSPPYFDAVQDVSPGHQGPEGGHLERQHLMAKLGKSGYGSSDNIGHIPRYGESVFGSIVLSPPYAGSLSASKNTKSFMSREERLRWASGERLRKRGMNYSPNPENIGNVPNYGENIFGSVIFSPPYSEGIGHPAGKNASSAYPWRLKYQRGMTEVWSEGSIAKLKHGSDLFGSVIFSPPFGEATRGGGIAKKGYEGKYGRDVKLKERCDRPISENPNNIGNMRYGRTYLSEMQKVYAECFKVLKPGKFMVVVVKDIRRQNLTIPLGADTIKLCQSVGFQCYEIIVNKMYFPSFWMVHHAQKMQRAGKPMALKTHEYVIVMKKPERSRKR